MSVKLKLIRQVVSPAEMLMLSDGRTAPYPDTTDFRPIEMNMIDFMTGNRRFQNSKRKKNTKKKKQQTNKKIPQDIYVHRQLI